MARRGSRRPKPTTPRILYTPDAYNIVFDHNSLSWAQGKNTDVFSVAEHAGITFWRNIISESLYRAQNVIIDRGQPSSLGMLVSQFYSQEAANVSILGNLFAHNSARNPEIQGPVNVHFINNVVYDWGKDATNYQWATFIYGAGASAPPKVAVIGNTYIAGPGPLPFKPLYADWGVQRAGRDEDLPLRQCAGRQGAAVGSSRVFHQRCGPPGQFIAG